MKTTARSNMRAQKAVLCVGRYARARNRTFDSQKYGSKLASVQIDNTNNTFCCDICNLVLQTQRRVTEFDAIALAVEKH